MDLQVRYKMNGLDLGKGVAKMPDGNLWGPHTSEPEVDYRDSGTVWVWIADDLCVSMDRELVERLVEGFKEQVAWEKVIEISNRIEQYMKEEGKSDTELHQGIQSILEDEIKE